MKRVRVKPRSANDVRLAKKLERYLNSQPVRNDARRLFVNEILYGKDRTRWPN